MLFIQIDLMLMQVLNRDVSYLPYWLAYLSMTWMKNLKSLILEYKLVMKIDNSVLNIFLLKPKFSSLLNKMLLFILSYAFLKSIKAAKVLIFFSLRVSIIEVKVDKGM
jgi:hypothetical protein